MHHNYRNKILRLFFCIFAITPFGSVRALDPMQLRTHLNLKLPVDPLYLKSMAAYDYSLLMFRPWFNYDSARKPRAGLIKSWTFKEGVYYFTVAENAWSDGSRVTSSDFLFNLKRILKSDTSYGHSLSSLVDPSSLTEISDTEFSFSMKSKKPSEVLFSQMGSVFLSMVSPKDFDAKGAKVKSNKVSIGPYRVKTSEPERQVLERNPYHKFSNLNAPKEVVIDFREQAIDLETFLTEKSWDNYYQTSTLLPADLALKVKKSKLKKWSRGFDRVSLITPLGSGKRLADQKRVLREMGSNLSSRELKHPLQVKIARSLQPLGYPLFDELKFSEVFTKPLKRRSFKVLSYTHPVLSLHKEFLNSVGAELGIDWEWKIVSQSEFLAKKWSTFGVDFVVFAFGVADPEPTTWLGLVFVSGFVSASAEEHAQFKKIMSERIEEKQVQKYRKLLRSIGEDGGYLPLLHGATLSLGSPEMNFDLVDPLDETVDYSKIQIFKK